MNTYDCWVSSDEMYPNGYVIPEGFLFKDFRLPKAGDLYLSSSGRTVNTRNHINDVFDGPRIILVKATRRVCLSVDLPRTQNLAKVPLTITYAGVECKIHSVSEISAV